MFLRKAAIEVLTSCLFAWWFSTLGRQTRKALWRWLLELFLTGVALGESTKGILFENTEYRLGTGWGAETLCKTDLYQLFLLFIRLAVRSNLWVSSKGGCIFEKLMVLLI